MTVVPCCLPAIRPFALVHLAHVGQMLLICMLFVSHEVAGQSNAGDLEFHSDWRTQGPLSKSMRSREEILGNELLRISQSGDELGEDDFWSSLGQSAEGAPEMQISELRRAKRVWRKSDDTPAIEYSVLGRGFYISDQRMQFTGNETTFAAEAQLDFNICHQIHTWHVGLVSETYLTQPFDNNMLADYELRESFRHNFLIDPIEISELFIELERGPLRFKLGRFETPFGRYWSPFYLNSRQDVPFIRSEAILFRETGLQIDYFVGPWIVSSALTNGGLNRDTNSSKALISRIGYERHEFVVGGSIKWQDGIGSEGQKEFKQHVGIDMMRRLGPNWMVSSEVIYDEYGLKRPGIELDEIFWGRSLYNRQLNRALGVPLSGWGYYANLNWERPRGLGTVGYGEFYPNPVGDRIHDTVTRRMITSYQHGFDNHFSVYGSHILENSVENAQNGVRRNGSMLILGLQYLW